MRNLNGVGTDRPSAAVQAALDDYLWPSPNSCHPSEKPIRVDHLVTISQLKGFPHTGPDITVGLILYVRVGNLYSGNHKQGKNTVNDIAKDIYKHAGVWCFWKVAVATDQTNGKHGGSSCSKHCPLHSAPQTPEYTLHTRTPETHRQSRLNTHKLSAQKCSFNCRLFI